MMKYFLLIILSILFFPAASQTDFSTEELTYIYDQNADVKLDADHYYDSDGDLNVLLHIVLRSGIYMLEDYKLYYTFSDSYTRNLEQFTIIESQKYLLKQVRFNYFFNLKLQNTSGSKYLFIFIQNEKTGERYSIDLDVDPSRRTGNPGVFLWDNELEYKFQRTYVSQFDSVPIKSLTGDEKLTLYHYSFDFDPADPPFTERSGESRLMKIDSTFEVSDSDYLSGLGTGLYLAQSDTNSMKGMSFRVERPTFPGLTRLDDLINSLIYFSSSSEYQAMISAGDKKKAFDSFWLKIMRTRDRARRMIKFYYDRVEMANKLFTTFKEGWKTDKGMVYIIKGAPDVVYRKEEEEVWLYSKTEDVPRMKFQFLKVENIFDPDHWVLIRDRSYREDWFKSIEYLRKNQ
jgi:GWxTD domain-containing protein